MSTPPTDPPARVWLPWLGWLTGSMFFFYAWILRVSPSVMVDELMRDFAVGGAILGNLSALYFYGYAGMQIPVGLLIDRFGPRRLMTAAAGVCALGCVLFAFSHGILSASVGRFLIGAGSAFSLVGAMAVAGQWFPVHRFALLSGLAMMIGMAGGVFGQAPLRFAVEILDWRTTILFAATGGAFIMLCAWLTVRDRQRGSGGVGDVMRGLGDVAKNSQTWLNAVAGLGATGPLLGFAGLWGVPYLEVLYGVDRVTAGATTSLVFVGWGLGAPLIGWASDRIGRRKPPLICGLLVCASSMAIIAFVPGVSLSMMQVLCFTVGLGGSAQIVNFALAREHNPAGLSGTAIGVVNAFVTGAGALFQPLVGWLLDLRWAGLLVDGARIYDIAAYRFALGVVVVGVLIGLACAVVLRDMRAR